MAYAILRIAKLRTLANLSGSARHNFRERTTLNADPDKTQSNITSGALSAMEVLKYAKERLATQAKIRKNAVRAIEYFIGASPEWFVESSKESREAYFHQAEQWLKQRHGEENLISFTRQYDETSPHVCAYVVPIDPKGKLNSSHFINGRKMLSEMQTEFAEKVGKQFGLIRGIEGSKAKHTKIKEYYARIQASTPQVKTHVPQVAAASIGQNIIKSIGIPNDHSRAIKRQEKLKQKRADEEKALQKAIEDKSKQYDLEKRNRGAVEARLEEMRQNAIQVRNIPLESVLKRLECYRDDMDENNWRTPAGRITVTDSKFYAHDQQKGGGGAIDLVMMIEQSDYKTAVNRLSNEFGTAATLEQVISDIKPKIEAISKAPEIAFKPPESKKENWPKVREYLNKIRCICYFRCF